MSYFSNAVGASSLNKQPISSVGETFASSLANNFFLPDLNPDQKQILRDYCALMDRELVDYGDFPSLQNDKKNIKRIKLTNINGESLGAPRYYPDYIFMRDGMKYSVLSNYGYKNKTGVRSLIKDALAYLELVGSTQDNPPKDYASSKLLVLVYEKLSDAKADLEIEIKYFIKQANALYDAGLATNDDWNYYKKAFPCLTKLMRGSQT